MRWRSPEALVLLLFALAQSDALHGNRAMTTQLRLQSCLRTRSVCSIEGASQPDATCANPLYRLSIQAQAPTATAERASSTNDAYIL